MPNVDDTTRTSVEVLARAMGMRDRYTAGHSERVLDLVRRVAERLDLDPDEIAECEVAGRLHDLGQVRISDSILQKPGPLEPAEWDVMRCHPVWSAEMLSAVPGLEGAALIARHHHEHFDGTGYPDGLSGEEIPLASRIVAVCDAYDALLCERPYRRALRPREALRVVRSEAGAMFDPAVVRALAEALP